MSVIALGMGRKKENSFKSEKGCYLNSLPDEVLEHIYKMATNKREKFVKEFTITKGYTWGVSPFIVNLDWEKCGFTIVDDDIIEVHDLWMRTTGVDKMTQIDCTVGLDKAYSNMIKAFRTGQHKKLSEEDRDTFISNIKTLIQNYEEDESYSYFPNENQFYVEILFRIMYHHITAEDRETVLNIISKNQYRDTHSSRDSEHLLEMFYNKELDVANTVGLMIDQYFKGSYWWNNSLLSYLCDEKYALMKLFCIVDFGSDYS